MGADLIKPPTSRVKIELFLQEGSIFFRGEGSYFDIYCYYLLSCQISVQLISPGSDSDATKKLWVHIFPENLKFKKITMF